MTAEHSTQNPIVPLIKRWNCVGGLQMKEWEDYKWNNGALFLECKRAQNLSPFNQRFSKG